MNDLTFIDNGPVTGLPDHLTCGTCSAPVQDGLWTLAALPDGRPLGAFCFARCEACGSAVVGLIAPDAASRDALAAIAEDVLRETDRRLRRRRRAAAGSAAMPTGEQTPS